MPDRQVIADFARSMGIATSGLRAQAGRMRVISENIANADSTAPTAGGDPYRRKIATLTSDFDRELMSTTLPSSLSVNRTAVFSSPV